MVDGNRRKLLADFLRTHRAQLAPPDGTHHPRRRTAGLTREEVAERAGISTTWYTWSEQGRDIHLSSAALAGIAEALELSAGERQYLFALSGLSPSLAAINSDHQLLPRLQAVLDSYGLSPAQLLGPRLDILAVNAAANTVFLDYHRLPMHQRNVAWQLFRNPAMRELVVDWEANARGVLAMLRLSWGQHHDDPAFTVLIDDLRAGSDEFRAWWSLHDVTSRPVERKELNHPLVGRLVFHQHGFQVVDHPDLTMVLDTPWEGTETGAKLQQLVGRSNR